MIRVEQSLRLLLRFVSFAACSGALLATPIIYESVLSNGVPVLGSISQPNGSQDNPEGAVYYSFTANAGDLITVFGDRLSGPYDMSFWIFQGLFADTTAFGGSIDDSDLGFIAFGDDEDSPNIPGPFGDPRSLFAAPSTGVYTVVVTNFESDGTPPYEFLLQADITSAVPEPSTLSFVVLGASLLAVAFFRSRRR
jgi:hypothetical protein